MADTDGNLLYFDGRVLMRRINRSTRTEPGKGTIFPTRRQAERAVASDRHAVALANRGKGGRTEDWLPPMECAIIPLYRGTS